MVTGDVADLSTEIDGQIPFESALSCYNITIYSLTVLNSFENTFNFCSKL